MQCASPSSSVVPLLRVSILLSVMHRHTTFISSFSTLLEFVACAGLGRCLHRRAAGGQAGSGRGDGADSQG